MKAGHVEDVEVLRGSELRGPTWPAMLATGLFLIALGAMAIVLPFVTALTIEALMSLVLIVAGVVQIVNAFEVRRSGGFALRVITGGLYLAAGILLLAYPLRGLLTLTVILAGLFVIAGASRISLAFHVRPAGSWVWLFLSGAISMLIGILIWAGLPGNAVWAIGLLVGIELIISGLAMSTSAWSSRGSSGE